MPGWRSCFSSTVSCGSTIASSTPETTTGQSLAPATNECGAGPAAPVFSSPVLKTFLHPEAHAFGRIPSAPSVQCARMTDATRTPPALKKAPTGIPGLDEITGGGLPAGRPTLVAGGPG